VLAQTDPSNLLVCGTNSFNPRCRTYSNLRPAGNSSKDEEDEDNDGTRFTVRHDFSGKGFCPYDPKHNSTAIFSGTQAREFH
jgi:semaphorin 6